MKIPITNGQSTFALVQGAVYPPAVVPIKLLYGQGFNTQKKNVPYGKHTIV